MFEKKDEISGKNKICLVLTKKIRNLVSTIRKIDATDLK